MSKSALGAVSSVSSSLVSLKSRFVEVLLFAVFVTLFMNGLDMTYHLLTGWVVHLNYAAIKLTMIFVASFLVTWLLGVGRKQNVVASIAGPLAFYMYYLFANPTLDRAVFMLDEQFWFFFLHVAFMLVAYGTISANWSNSLARIVSSWWCSFTAGLLGLMAVWRLAGIAEEEAAKALTFQVALPLHIIIILAGVVTFVVDYLASKEVAFSASSRFAKPFRLFVVIVSLMVWRLVLAPFVIIVGLGFWQGWTVGLLSGVVYCVVQYYSGSGYFEDLRDKKKTPIAKLVWLWIAIPSLILGAFYEFVPRTVIKSISPTLLFDFTIGSKRIRQNDLILVATLLLLIGGIVVYTLISAKRYGAKNMNSE